MGFMMAGCVFWEGAGVDLGVFLGAACNPAEILYVNICASFKKKCN